MKAKLEPFLALDRPTGAVWLCQDCFSVTAAAKPYAITQKVDSSKEESTVEEPVVEQEQDLTEGQPEEESAMVHDEVKEVPNPKVDSSKPGEVKSETNNGDNDSKGFKTTPPNQRPGVCPGYRHGNCPHGLNGRKRIDGAKCSKAHPSYCYKWRKAGSDPIRGCTEGRNCRYFHPIVCKLSAKGQRCEKEECSYLHLQRAPKKRKSTVSHRTGPSPAPPAKSA